MFENISGKEKIKFILHIVAICSIFLACVLSIIGSIPIIQWENTSGWVSLLDPLKPFAIISVTLCLIIIIAATAALIILLKKKKYNLWLSVTTLSLISITATLQIPSADLYEIIFAGEILFFAAFIIFIVLSGTFAKAKTLKLFAINGFLFTFLFTITATFLDSQNHYVELPEILSSAGIGIVFAVFSVSVISVIPALETEFKKKTGLWFIASAPFILWIAIFEIASVSELYDTMLSLVFIIAWPVVYGIITAGTFFLYRKEKKQTYIN